MEKRFHAVSVASIDSNLSNLQPIELQKGEAIAANFNQILELASELESTDHTILELEKKRAFFPVLTKSFEICPEVIIDGSYTYHEAVLKLISLEVKLQETEDCPETAWVVSGNSKKFNACGEMEQLPKYCRKQKTQKKFGNKSDWKESLRWFVRD